MVEATKRANTRHGLTGTVEHKAWLEMRKRCKTCGTYANRRGVTICERWSKFEHFLDDMGKAPEGGTLDRKDATGNYEPSNCRWITIAEQQRNRTNNVVIEHEGKKKCAAEWAREAGLKSSHSLMRRLRRGWTVEEAVTAKPDRFAGRFVKGSSGRHSRHTSRL
jgi:hypothetical protein